MSETDIASEEEKQSKENNKFNLLLHNSLKSIWLYADSLTQYSMALVDINTL